MQAFPCVTIGHSPDADDAFMFYPLASGEVRAVGLEVVEILQDIETLNARCLRGELHVSAASVHAYAYLADRYALLSCGASMGEGYGPRLVSRSARTVEALEGRTIAIPGLLTSATLALRMLLPRFEPRVVPFDRILEAVEGGEADAGLVIHEGQLTYDRHGLRLVADLGDWWLKETGLPLPLGVNVVRRDLGEQRIRELARLLRESIDYALDHRDAALDHAMGYARGLDRAAADRFVGMYVNDLTRDLGERGREAIRVFQRRAFQGGLIPHAVSLDFVES